MATQKEWQEINYQRELGKQGIKTGSMHNAAGYEQYKATQSSRGTGSGCFPSETLILTPTGWRRIDAVERDQYVMTFDSETGQIAAGRVIARREYSRRRLWAILLDGRQKPISTTSSHSFLTARGWTAARGLKAGDVVRSDDGSWMAVVSCRRTERVETVYNLVTEGNQTFVADGCIVHSFTHFRALRMLWYRLHSRGWRAAPGEPKCAHQSDADGMPVAFRRQRQLS